MRFPALWLVALASASLVHGQAPAASDEQELQDLMAVLAEETEVATKTKMNGDFVPGIVSVLQGDELEALGVETVGEALGLVPGIQAVRDPPGRPSAIVRGVDFPFNSGNLKVLVDGVSLSRDNAGINGIVLSIPVQQVERIEVIRGPGSVLYGDFAFMGLANIVTRREGSRASLRAGGDDAISASGHLGWQSRGGTELALGLAGWTSDDAPVAAPRQLSEQRGFARLGLRRGGLRLRAGLLSRDADEVSAAQGPAATGTQTHGVLEARQSWELRPTLRLELRGGYLHNRFSEPSQSFRGDVLEGGAELGFQPSPRHDVLASIGFGRNHIDSASLSPAPLPPPPPGVPPRPQLVQATAVSDVRRDVFGLALQDRFEVSSRVALTGGVRFDHASDVGSRFTPRLALLFRVSERNILKLQHAEGFRAPTFFEQFSGDGNSELDFEVNATSELNFVHRRPRLVARATLFRARLRDMIFTVSPGRFDNSRQATAQGFELEWSQQLVPSLKLQANLSFVDEEDDRNAEAVPRTTAPAADWLGNLMLLWHPTARSLVGLRLSHVGDRHSETDPEGHDLLDVTVSQSHLFWPGLQLRAGVKNAFDSEVRYLTALPGTLLVSRFPGRTFWAQLAWGR